MNKNISELFFYHGSPFEITEFSFEFMGHGNDALGSGFYFTTSRKDAMGYTEQNEVSKKLLKDSPTPTIHKAKLSLQSPLESRHVQSLSARQVRNIMERSSNIIEALNDFEEVNRVGYEKVIQKVSLYYASNNESPLLETLNLLSNDFFRHSIKEFNEAVREVLGYDGVIDRQGKTCVAVAWFPEQVKIVSRSRHVKIENDFSPSR